MQVHALTEKFVEAISNSQAIANAYTILTILTNQYSKHGWLTPQRMPAPFCLWKFQ
jgi:hypothetical protein